MVGALVPTTEDLEKKKGKGKENWPRFICSLFRFLFSLAGVSPGEVCSTVSSFTTHTWMMVTGPLPSPRLASGVPDQEQLMESDVTAGDPALAFPSELQFQCPLLLPVQFL